jgi:hypothetical protein
MVSSFGIIAQVCHRNVSSGILHHIPGLYPWC